MASEAERAHAIFESKVTRSVFIDNLSPQATEAHIKAALEQFTRVVKVQFIRRYAEPYLTSRCALVELEKAKQTSHLVDLINSYPFMICGKPRPVRAKHAEEEMFEDRPPKRNRKITLFWSDPIDKDFQVTRRLTELAVKHDAELSAMLKHELKEEEELAKRQEGFLKSAYETYVLMEENLDETSINRILQYYSGDPDNSKTGRD